MLLSVSVGEVHEVRVQPLLVRRSVTDFPSLDRLPVSPCMPLSPGLRSPSTPSLFDDLGSLDPILYTMVAEVRLQKYLGFIKGLIMLFHFSVPSHSYTSFINLAC